MAESLTTVGSTTTELEPLAAPGPALTAKPQAVLTLQSSQYISSGQTYFRKTAKGQNNSLGLSLFHEGRWRGIDGVARLRDEYSATENWNYLDVHEFYASTRIAPDWTVSAGRQRDRWTEWEGPWRQGLFQPRYAENRLHPQTAGLTGLFVQGRGSDLSFSAGLLAYIPEFGPHFSTEDNRFASANPWFHPPASQFNYRGQISDIHFSLREPDAFDVINHPGGVAKLEFHRGSYFSRLSYAYKPIPQLLLGFPSRERMKMTANDDYMNIEINTRVLYHQVLDWDNVMQAGPWRLTGSLALERPDSDTGPEDWTSQQVRPAVITALGVSRPLEAEGPNAARVTVSLLKVDGGDAPDGGDFASKRTLFSRRYDYQEAAMVELAKPWRGLLRRPLTTSVRAIYDRRQNGGVFCFESGMDLGEGWSADLQVDFLGLFAGRAEVTDGLLSTYRANDRVALGMSYVF